MGFSVIPNRPFPYVLKQHRELPEGERPVFQLRHIGSRTMAEILTLAARDPGRGAWVAVCIGVVGWEGLERDGSPFEFRPAPHKPRNLHGLTVQGGASEDSIDALPFDVVLELANQLTEANTLDRESAKN